MYVAYWYNIRVIRRVSKLFRADILLLIDVYSLVNVVVKHSSLFVTHSESFVWN